MPRHLASLLSASLWEASDHPHTSSSSTYLGISSCENGNYGKLRHTLDAAATAGAAQASKRMKFSSFLATAFDNEDHGNGQAVHDNRGDDNHEKGQATQDHSGNENHDAEKPTHHDSGQVIHYHAPIDSAEATSTYTKDVQSGGPAYMYGPKRALAPGSGYWCSSGRHSKKDVITWKGFLHRRRPVTGMKIAWAYAPGEVRIRTTPDTLQWDTVVNWHKPLSTDTPSFEEVFVFDRPRNVMAVDVDMRKPKDWGYFGINQATLVM